MRITGGVGRGLPLQTPRGDKTRPATDQMREALFSSLGNWIEGKVVLDLFAGTGSYGLEAASRGAARVSLVERDAKALQALKQNVGVLQKGFFSAGLPFPELAVTRGDARKPTIWPGGGYDLVFIDPPYRDVAEVGPEIMIALATLKGGAPIRVAWETAGDQALDFPGWVLWKSIGKEKKDSPRVRVFEPK